MKSILGLLVMNMLLVSAYVRGQQPIMFDTVRLNPLNSFLIGLSVFESEDGYRVWGMAGVGTGDVQDVHVLSFDEEGGYQNDFAFSNDRLTWPGSYGPVTRSASGGFASGVSIFSGGVQISSL